MSIEPSAADQHVADESLRLPSAFESSDGISDGSRRRLLSKSLDTGRAAGEVRYQCPGEPYQISYAVHLGRLVDGYAKCRQCPHRGETAILAPRVVRQLAAVRRPAAEGGLFHPEGVAGTYWNDLAPPDARRLAGALGVFLREQPAPPAAEPVALVASDGRPLLAELVAAVSDGLRWSGHHVIDIGAASAACLVTAAQQAQAAGAVLISQLDAVPHGIALKFWGADGAPLSSPGQLDRVRELWERGPDRPRRRAGRCERQAPAETYLREIADYFHALRPLRFVLDCQCRPLAAYLEGLLARVACQALPAAYPKRPTSHSAPAMRQSVGAIRGEAVGRLEALGQQVRETAAHFGIWIDGDGEALALVDERGKRVESAALLPILLAQCTTDSNAPIVVEDETRPGVVDEFAARGVRVLRATATRAEMHRTLVAQGAPFGGGPSGRFWYAGPRAPIADALRSAALLLVALSQSDQPLSAILARS